MRFLATILLALFVAFPALAQTQCGARDSIVASLEDRYSEVPVSMGLASNGAMIEVFASETGSFTIIITQPNGVSCMVAAGAYWEDLPARAKPDDTNLGSS